MTFTFFVPGRPKAKARARSKVGKSGKPFVYPDGKTKMYEDYVGLLCKQAMRGKRPLKGPIRLEVIFCFAVPKSWTKAKKAMVPMPYMGRPDLDNLIKAIKDGVNKIAWMDDSQVVTYGETGKRYSNNAEGAYVSFWEI